MPSLPILVRDISGALVAGLVDRETGAKRKALVIGGFVGSGLRLAAGMTVRRAIGPRPTARLRLWDFERCPWSRLVRETLSELDLDAEVRPCPRGGTRFRPELDGGSVPRLEDPEAGVTIVGAREIVRHLHARYGTGRAPRLLAAKPVVMGTGLAMRFLTGQRGALARPSRAPKEPLELWSFEASPYCRFVRSTLCELELPYVLHNVAKDSPRRATFVAVSGRMQVPCLFDPNTGVRLFESLLIERYLEQTYGGLTEIPAG